MAYSADYQRMYREAHREEMAAYRLDNRERISLQRKEYRDRTREIKVKQPGTMTRGEAIEQGVDRYYTGARCKNGHLSERTINNGCVDCVKERIERGDYKNKPKSEVN